jgi:hypothetical protein
MDSAHRLRGGLSRIDDPRLGRSRQKSPHGQHPATIGINFMRPEQVERIFVPTLEQRYHTT